MIASLFPFWVGFWGGGGGWGWSCGWTRSVILDWRPEAGEESGLVSGECSSFCFFRDAAVVVVVVVLLLVLSLVVLLLLLAAEVRGLRVLTSFFVPLSASFPFSFSFSFSLRARVRFGLMGCGSLLLLGWLVGDPVARGRRVFVSAGRESPSCRSSPPAPAWSAATAVVVVAVVLLFLLPLAFACSDGTVV